jgi:PTS system nitrogen regulatory IIA component
MKLTDLLKPDDVAIDVKAGSKPRLLAHLAQRASAATGLAEEVILEALHAREDLGSTGIGKGIALPHAMVKGLTKPFGSFARLLDPLDFNAIDGAPVDLVFLLLLPQPNGGSEKNALSCVARCLRAPEAQAALRAAEDADGIFAFLTAFDDVQDPGGGSS